MQRAIYRIRNGQDPSKIAIDFRSGNPVQDAAKWRGIFGGYSFYDMLVNIRMLSVSMYVFCPELSRIKGLSLSLNL
jgi:hypothetical protein